MQLEYDLKLVCQWAVLLQEQDLRYVQELQELEEKGVSGRLGKPKQSAIQAWNKIKERMKPPKCRGHNEDCVIRQVKKKGPNHGIFIYTVDAQTESTVSLHCETAQLILIFPRLITK